MHNNQISNIDGQTPAHRIYGKAQKIPLLTVENMNFADVENAIHSSEDQNSRFFRTCEQIAKCREIWQQKDCDARILRGISRANRKNNQELDFKIGQTVFFLAAE